jgi:hypothetical protein
VNGARRDEKGRDGLGVGGRAGEGTGDTKTGQALMHGIK